MPVFTNHASFALDNILGYQDANEILDNTKYLKDQLEIDHSTTGRHKSTIKLGDADDQKSIIAYQDGVSDPELRYSTVSDKWQLSHDGSTFVQIAGLELAQTWTQVNKFTASGHLFGGLTSLVASGTGDTVVTQFGSTTTGSYDVEIVGSRAADAAIGGLGFVNNAVGGAEKRLVGFYAFRDGADNTGKLSLYMANAGSLTEKFTVTGAGLVGINKTSSIGARLHVVAGSATEKGLIVSTAASPSGSGFVILEAQNNGTLVFKFGLSTTQGAAGHAATFNSQGYDLANDATAVIDTYSGLLFVILNSIANGCAEFGINSSNNSVNLLSGSGAVFTVTKDNAGTFNVYYDAVDARYEIQNKTGSTKHVALYQLANA